MARPRKTMKFEQVLSPLSIADLKILKTEVTSEIRVKERDLARAKSEEQARKIRDKIRIGQKIVFSEKGKKIKAEVIGIFTDKVQISVAGRKRSIALSRIESIG